LALACAYDALDMGSFPGSDTLPVVPNVQLVAPGTIVGGKYEVAEQLGEGGMGVVVRALHLTLHEPVAIKFLKASAVERSVAVERFVREARAAATLKNEHIVKVFDVGVHEGMPYLVMEFLEGRGVGEWVHTEGPMSLPMAVDVVLQASDAMADAHARGIIHRDLKPNNLVLTRRSDGSPFVKVLDFGLATAPLDEELGEVRLTKTDATFGSPAYMPPEQIREARRTDGRSDVWALGIILYEMLTGRLPFEGATATAILAAISADTPRPATEGRPDLELVWPVIERCLRKDPNERFQSVSDFASALAPFGSAEGAVLGARAARRRSLAPEGSAGSLPGPLVASNPTTGRTLSMVVSESKLAPSRSRAVAIAIAVVTVLSGAALVGSGWVGRAKEPSSQASPSLPTPQPPQPSSRPASSDVSQVALQPEPSSVSSARREVSLTSSTVKVPHVAHERPPAAVPSQETNPKPTVVPSAAPPDDLSNLRK
jgi:eukaryotic-like serine/threonine-protein kinase